MNSLPHPLRIATWNVLGQRFYEKYSNCPCVPEAQRLATFQAVLDALAAAGTLPDVIALQEFPFRPTPCDWRSPLAAHGFFGVFDPIRGIDQRYGLATFARAQTCSINVETAATIPLNNRCKGIVVTDVSQKAETARRFVVCNGHFPYGRKNSRLIATARFAAESELAVRGASTGFLLGDFNERCDAVTAALTGPAALGAPPVVWQELTAGLLWTSRLPNDGNAQIDYIWQCRAGAAADAALPPPAVTVEPAAASSLLPHCRTATFPAGWAPSVSDHAMLTATTAVVTSQASE